jgi:putative ATPase
MDRPLADEIRPQTLDEVVGQRHLLGEGRRAAPSH